MLTDASRNGNFGHSAEVRMHLRLNGQVLPIAQLGPDFLVLKDPIDHPSADAEIDLTIDGVEDRWRVHLIEGLAIEKRKATLRPVNEKHRRRNPISGATRHFPLSSCERSAIVLCQSLGNNLEGPLTYKLKFAGSRI